MTRCARRWRKGEVADPPPEIRGDGCHVGVGAPRDSANNHKSAAKLKAVSGRSGALSGAPLRPVEDVGGHVGLWRGSI